MLAVWNYVLWYFAFSCIHIVYCFHISHSFTFSMSYPFLLSVYYPPSCPFLSFFKFLLPLSFFPCFLSFHLSSPSLLSSFLWDRASLYIYHKLSSNSWISASLSLLSPRIVGISYLAHLYVFFKWSTAHFINLKNVSVSLSRLSDPNEE